MRFLVFILLLPLVLWAHGDALFPEDADLTLNTHVNVISGHLNLHFQDALIQGAVPLSLTRTYSSAGALEKHSELIRLQDHTANWILQAGWSMLSHLNLLITKNDEHLVVYLPEKGGAFIPYKQVQYEHDGRHWVYTFKPEIQTGQCAGVLSARTNPKNNVLRYCPSTRSATLLLPDGGTRVYNCVDCKFKRSINAYPVFLSLTKEVLPNRQQVVYTYDEKHRLVGMASQNPSGNKTFASAHFTLFKTGKRNQRDKTHNFHYRCITSDKKLLDYRSSKTKDVNFLCDVQGNCRPHEALHFIPARKHATVRMHALSLGDVCQFKVHYYKPNQIGKHSDVPADKVSLIEGPMGTKGGTKGAFIPIARFCYQKNRTDMRDVEDLLTRYTHDGGVLKEVEYFDRGDRPHSLLKLYWDGPRLKGKVHFCTPNEALFSKTFQYDEAGNVTTETFYGNLTGKAASFFHADAHGALPEAESYTKRYTYLPQFNVPLTEEEEGGLTYRYAYKAGTNLLTARLICDKDAILLRQFHFYDEDHLLTCTIDDDGVTSDPEDLTGVTERHIQRYTLDPRTGMAAERWEGYWDASTHSEKLLKRSVYTYSPENRVIGEDVYDAADAHRYTLHTTYDAQGRVLSKTTPLGQTNTYAYDQQGHIIDCKEVGKPRTLHRYDAAGQPTACEEIGEDQQSRITYTEYDAKGRLIHYTDPKGNTTAQSYDAFGRCTLTEFPPVKDHGVIKVHYHYDLLGNLTHTTSAGQDSAQTVYNTLKKPIRITQSDGSVLTHAYNKNGTLTHTVYSDGVEVHYSYDILQRMTAKRTLDADKVVRAEEAWTYNAFHLVTHTLENGRVIHYSYDGAGRKASESSEGRIQTFTYDPLGYLERTGDGVITKIQLHDVGGRVVEDYVEQNGCIENHTVFAYDNENRKVSARRLTSQGVSLDTFAYDSEGRLCRHEDPLGAVTQFLHSALQKCTIDPIGNQKVETFDALSRCISLQRRDCDGRLVAWEEYSYDEAGHRSRRTTHIFQGSTEVTQIGTVWEYDSCGRVVKEIESDQKITASSYDIRGRLSCKTLSDGTNLFYTYDCLGRLAQLRSSDGTVHYQYTYAQGAQPTRILDLLTQQELCRTYNLFDQVVEEITLEGLQTRWEYDLQGRCTCMQLPDRSYIAYVYSGSHLAAVQRLDPSGNFLYQHRYTAFDANGHVTQESLIHDLGEQTTLHDLLERPVIQTCPWMQQGALYGPSGLVTSTQNSLLGDKTYSYDPLNQLIQESNTPYNFNSIGNSLDHTVDNCNRVLSTNDTTFSYDGNGNPLQRTTPEATVQYTYDALGRLTSITGPEERILYHYDPLSRLSSKETQNEKRLYLYDRDVEIGTVTPTLHILELKVLGLGLKKDIGATVAIELHGQTYAPLHDLSGNIIALLSPLGIVESYPTSAFGKESCPTPPINPWRFCSKRAESHLIFFGKRFYDPSLGRWLTPDPAGFTEGPNLYLYVLNSPLNRLDLFGLTSLKRFPNGSLDEKSIDIPMAISDIEYAKASPSRELLHSKGSIDGVETDWIVACGHWHKLEYTPEEIERGTVNIFDHLHEIMPKDGAYIGLITAQNGILNDLEDKHKMDRSILNKIPESALFIGIYNPSAGARDFIRVGHELFNHDTPIVTKTRQFMSVTADRLHTINPNLLWMHFAHSEGGLIYKRAHEGMTPESKELLQQHLLCYAFGPALSIPKAYAKETNNIYSTKDYLTKCLAAKETDNDYNITMRDCETPFWDRNLYFIDHAFSGATYQNALQKQIDSTRDKYAFYDNQTR